MSAWAWTRQGHVVVVVVVVLLLLLLLPPPFVAAACCQRTRKGTEQVAPIMTTALEMMRCSVGPRTHIVLFKVCGSGSNTGINEAV